MTHASSWAERAVALDLQTNLLVLDGARRDAQWGVWVKKTQTFYGGRVRDRMAAEQLAPAVMDGLQRAGTSLAECGAIVVGIGPGSYAGLRIALAFAKGLAHGTSLPLVAVSSLQAMLHEPVPASVALLNAFSGRIYAVGEGIDAGAHEPAALAEKTRGLRAVIDGEVPGVAALGLGETADLRALGHDLPLGVLTLGARAFAAGQLASRDALVPEYR